MEFVDQATLSPPEGYKDGSGLLDNALGGALGGHVFGAQHIQQLQVIQRLQQQRAAMLAARAAAGQQGQQTGSTQTSSGGGGTGASPAATAAATGQPAAAAATTTTIQQQPQTSPQQQTVCTECAECAECAAKQLHDEGRFDPFGTGPRFIRSKLGACSWHYRGCAEWPKLAAIAGK